MCVCGTWGMLVWWVHTKLCTALSKMKPHTRTRGCDWWIVFALGIWKTIEATLSLATVSHSRWNSALSANTILLLHFSPCEYHKYHVCQSHDCILTVSHITVSRHITLFMHPLNRLKYAHKMLVIVGSAVRYLVLNVYIGWTVSDS